MVKIAKLQMEERMKAAIAQPKMVVESMTMEDSGTRPKTIKTNGHIKHVM